METYIDFILLIVIAIIPLLITAYEEKSHFKTAGIFSLILAALTFGLATLSQMAFIHQVFLVLGLDIFGVVCVMMLNNTEIKLRNYGTVVVLILLVVAIPGYAWSLQGQVVNSAYLNNQITFEPASALFAHETLPIDAVPLVTLGFAKQIAQSHLSADFGGSSQITDEEQIVYHNSPYWIFTVSSTNTYTKNYEMGFVLVNAVNSSFFEIKQQTGIGPGLCSFCFSSIDVQSWFKDTNIGIGNWYPQPDGNKVLYVQTLDQPNFDGTTTFAGGIVYNPDGSVNNTYHSVDTAPSYVNQPWDRELLTTIAGQWADTRQANNSFSICAGGCGLWPAASSRLQLGNDSNTNYELIPYHDSTAVMLFMSPANAQRSLSGIMLATQTHIYYYDLSSLNYISPSYAQSQVQSNLGMVANGNLSTANPILYPVNGQFVYIIPYFFTDHTTNNIVFKGVGVVGASQTGSVITMPGSDIVATRDAALSAYFNGVTPTGISSTVNGTVSAMSNYIQGGNSFIALKISGTWYTASAPSATSTISTGLSFNDWYTLQNVQTGQTISLTVRGQSIIAVSS